MLHLLGRAVSLFASMITENKVPKLNRTESFITLSFCGENS